MLSSYFIRKVVELYLFFQKMAQDMPKKKFSFF